MQPIFAGFSSKILFGVAAYDSHSPKKFILVLLVLAVSSLLNALYFTRTMIRIYTAPSETKGIEYRELAEKNQKTDRDPAYVVPSLALTAVNVFLGLFSWVVVELIHRGLAMFA